MGFGANIRKLRTMEHLGQAQLAEMLGVSKETVCRWEKSRYAPRERHIEKLQALFGCTRDELVGEENGLAVSSQIKESSPTKTLLSTKWRAHFPSSISNRKSAASRTDNKMLARL